MSLVLEDKELIRRIQNGQTEYLNKIAEKYYDDIYYFCRYQTGSREDAYDLAQETFLRFIRYVDHYRYRNLKGYLLTIAMNLCREYMRAAAKTHSQENIIDPAAWHSILTSSETPHADSRTRTSENAVLLAEALLALPQTQREAVLLHHFYGYKNREIARMTGASYDAVKSRIRQGLQKLGKLLDPDDFREHL